MSLPKIGFVTYQNDPEVKDEVASTRIRITWALPYMPTAIVSEDFEELKTCDVVVFQTRIQTKDWQMAAKLRDLGVKIIFDFTDPHWIKEYDPDAIHPVFYKIAELSHCVTLPTEGIEKTFNAAFPFVRTEIVKDRLDLNLYNKIKEHKDTKEFKILWHGSYGNICSIDLARADLEKLGLEYKIKLICVYDKSTKYSVKPFKNIEVEVREWSNQKVIDSLLESDLSINPKYDNWKSYKSNNKTITAWALGIPCIERNFYAELKKYCQSSTLRNVIGQSLRQHVVKEYDVKETSKEWYDIANMLLSDNKRPIRKPKIVVYTALNGNCDGLREDQFETNTADFFVFTTDNVKSNVWQIKPFYAPFVDPILNSKMFKVLPWQYFSDYDYSIYIDGTIAIKSNPKELIEKFLNGFDFAVYKHAARDCIYDEYVVDMMYRKYEPSFLRELQREKYKAEGVPANVGLWECGILIRRHTESVKRLCEEWWSEITAFTSSDQCSFARTVYLRRFPINPMSPGTVYKNPYFNYVTHDKTWDYTLPENRENRGNNILRNTDLYQLAFHTEKIEEQLTNITCNANKISFIVLDDITPGIFNNMSERARLISKYIPQSQVNSSLDYLSGCDVVIYNNRFEPHDVEYVITNKHRKHFILDLNEAWWEDNFILTTPIRKQNCRQMMKVVDKVIVSNHNMERLIRKQFPDVNVSIIEDNKYTVQNFIRIINGLV